jgi:PAS domain S-box-containing protein/putative nucleotidyltransferase with HDIG domain
MSDSLEEQPHEQEATQRTPAESEARCVRHDVEHQGAAKKAAVDLSDTQKLIAQANQEWITALDAMEDPIFLHDKDCRILRCNLAYQRIAGISFKEIIGQLYYDVFPNTDAPLPNCRPAVEDTAAEEVQVGNATYRSRAIAVNDAQGVYLYSIHTLEDISESLRVTRALQDSEMQYRRLFEAAKDGILILDADSGKIIDANPYILNLLSYRLDECLGKMLWEIGLFKDIESSMEAFQELQAKGYIRYDDLPLETKDGRRIELEFVSNRYAVGERKVIQCNIRDISERKRAEKMLIASHDLLKTVIENVPVRVFWKDTESRYLGCNGAFAQDAGMSRAEDLIGKDDSQLAWREQAELYRADDKQVMDSGIPKLGYEEPQTAPDGRTIWIRTAKVPLRAADGKGFGVLGIYEDITERKLNENALRRANRALKTLSAGNLALVRAASEDELLRSVTRVIVEHGGFSIAAVCYAGNDPQKSIAPTAWFGTGEVPDCADQLTWADTEQGQLPVARAIRSGTPQICHDIASDPTFKPWKEAALAHGYVANLGLPLVSGGSTFGGLSIYSSEAGVFDEEEVRLLEELANDLAYGIITLRGRIEHEQHASILRQSLEQSIQTIAGTVEARDPYTAGHQRRVAELAAAIARQLNLPEEQVNGIHLAAIIHDLGKIQIPAEILSKPSRLNDVEYMLIKMHPQAGYDILKDVKFPWPIADIVLQHHERLDGSGYPHGLKGDHILLESKIMAVADVVEAMTTHRPYRPAMGILAALSEMERGRASAYDPAVVDACKALFAEKGFQFSA